ncbi:hypothetical protein BC749_1248 [Flavobacterium araucananum]|uniref:Uncharacterized protein n=1 Tax=Flavobacterium araucananum TaxID=946678 RepID=A0A227NQI7_9FLAO|nr:hypothetical protein [Flavobacterium araucananum]OXE99616.1 hypothetical protein B0A64_21170 [Flavobacterium araucananum]PWJ89261.1 hypothetical protein BC749_1248 [Flavobacterium araucananum]
MISELKNSESFRKLVARYFKTIKPVNNKTDIHIAEIRVLGYSELACITSSMLKLCILALEQDAPEVSRTVKNPSIDVALILEIVAQLLPVHEIEFLDEINQMYLDETENEEELPND